MAYHQPWGEEQRANAQQRGKVAQPERRADQPGRANSSASDPEYFFFLRVYRSADYACSDKSRSRIEL